MKGSELATLRRDAGLTQSRLAEYLEVHRVSVANWERSRFEISKSRELAIRTVIRDYLEDVFSEL